MYKRSKLILGIICISFLSIQAQDRGSFGVKGGFNLTDIRGDSDNDVRLAMHGGGYVQLDFLDEVFLQSDVLFSGQGHNARTSLDNKLRLVYLNIPIVVGYRVTDQVNVHGGPQLGFLVKAKSEFAGTKTDVKNNFNSTDIAFVVGGGYEFMDVFTGTIRYVRGLNDISSSINPGTRKNTAIQLSIAVKLAGFSGL